MAPSICEKHKKCCAQFQSLLGYLKNDGQNSLHGRLSDEFDKYRIWADSVGAVHSPSSSRSLDHRLRFASPYREEVSTHPGIPSTAAAEPRFDREDPRYPGKPTR
jgi:hypothetical protein